MKYNEEKLWIAVIERAIQDAVGKNAELKKEAIKWFYSNDFETVCELANLSSRRMKNMLLGYGGLMSKMETNALLVDNIKECVSYLIPGGKFYKEKTYVGSLNGDTITVKIVGKKAGNWRNFTQGISGDIIDLWTLIKGDVNSAKEWLSKKPQEKTQKKGETKALSLRQYLNDQSPLPKDVVGPRILTPGGLLVIGGTPKVGKSSFLLSLLIHMAAGIPFLNMKSARPLKILYLQDEMECGDMRGRLQQLKISQKVIDLTKENLVIASETKITLNDAGVERIKDIIMKKFGTKMIDLIAIDSLTTHFITLSSLQNGIEKLRSATSPAVGIIITRHTKKVSTSALEQNPFQALIGANALRSYYTAGIVILQPNRHEDTLHVVYELRNRRPIPKKLVSRTDGCWKASNVVNIA
ncbi:MAG: hypothetical protein PG978_000692 [Wolbachia endosymbiont of Ctenocephalides felis wCfeF]|nr:MAG: hypothetical protein PG978_000692 [Wolbachia endosymbiont of Ctenocephalides felis wCfeF]